MRLSGWKFLPHVFTLAPACDDGTAPPPQLRGNYVLESINSSPPPAIVLSREGYTTTVIWSTLDFDAGDYAILVQRIRYASPNAPPTEVTHTTRYSYRFNGESIAFDYSPPCPANALCVAPPTGKVDASTVTLFYAADSPFTGVSVYRLSGLD